VARSDDRKEPMPRDFPDRMDAEALAARSDAFRRFTQRKGLPMTYGAGKEAGLIASAVAKVEKKGRAS
jgi:hypothetical protein